MDRGPQIDRLLVRLRASAAPVIQVWGWPGSGRAELLAALLAEEADAAHGLAPGAVSAEAVREAVAGGARWVVLHALPRAAEPHALVAELAEALPAGRRLVFATRRRVAVPDLLCDLLAPADLALSADEVAALALEAGAPLPSAERAARAAAAGDGWYRPLRLAAEAAAEAGEPLPDDPAALAAVPAVARFLRRSVIADLSPEERDMLLAPGTGPRGGEGGRRLDEELGWWVDGGAGPRAPYVLGVALGAHGTGEPAVPPAPAADEPPWLDLPVPDLAGDERFRLHLLGRPAAWRRDPAGWRRLHWPLKRALRVLAYLASSPERRAAREELVEALWSDEPAEAVAKNFHPTLSHLRRGLREGAPEGDGLQPLTRVDGVYQLAPELGWWSDLDALGRLEEAGAEHAAAGRDEQAIATWGAAWRLYRGHFLEGSYEPWVLHRREEHQRRHLRLLQGLAAALSRRGRFAEAIDAHRAVLVEDPLQEAAHAALMRLYARGGRRDLVRRQYDRLTVLLRDELGVEPLPETTREFHRLLTARGADDR